MHNRFIFNTIAFAFLLVMPLAVRSQTLVLNYFTATPSGSDVMVQWEIPEEGGVSQFKLMRKIDNETDFKVITTVIPTGSRSYSFLDAAVFKDAPRVVTYQLQITRNGIVYSYYANLLHNPTSVQRTWGSIKAMFR